MTFYIPLERKVNADQLSIKDLGLKMYGIEGMMSYSDITVRIFRKLTPLKHQFERQFDYNHFLPKDSGYKNSHYDLQ